MAGLSKSESHKTILCIRIKRNINYDFICNFLNFFSSIKFIRLTPSGCLFCCLTDKLFTFETNQIDKSKPHYHLVSFGKMQKLYVPETRKENGISIFAIYQKVFFSS